MLYLVGGEQSPYYAGLNLILVGASILPWEVSKFVIVVLISFGSYLLSAVLSTPDISVDWQVFGANFFFIASTAAIAISYTFLNSRARRKEFQLIYDLNINEIRLNKQNTDLENTLKTLRETEDQLIQSEKMNAIGSLAAGMLHEINNPLNYSKTACYLAIENTDKNNDNYDMLCDIKEGITRIQDIIETLRSFAAPDHSKHTTIEIVSAVTDALKMISSEVDTIVIKQENISGFSVKGSRLQLSQLFINLLMNSIRSIKQKNSNDGLIEIKGEKSDNGVKITIYDNGVGIEKDKISRIFEPFYTTSDVGEGLGLGMSICHTIASNHNATMEIKSRAGEFTIISILFQQPDCNEVRL